MKFNFEKKKKKKKKKKQPTSRSASSPFHVLLWELARFCETRYDVRAYDALVRYGGRSLRDIAAARGQAAAELAACEAEITAIEAELQRRAGSNGSGDEV
jgi:hypothetical protein